METAKLISALESLLFISGEPLSYGRLEKTLAASKDELRAAAEALAKRYADDAASGLIILFEGSQVAMATKPENAAHVEAFTKSALTESLSKAALEVLAIIAYRAPVTRAEIDAIRGVNCSFTLRNLLLRGLIDREGNPDDSRGYIYRPAFRFLEVLGLSKTSDLPDFEALSQDERLTMILEEEAEEAAALGESVRPEEVSGATSAGSSESLTPSL
jgi:segregation and condensation protein B